MPLTSDQLIEDPVDRYPGATVACLDPTRGELPRRQLDEGRTVAMLERYAGLGVEAVLIAASTGQGQLRTVGELEAWLRCAAWADVGEMLRIALLRPEDGQAVTTRLMDLAAEWGYPVVFLRPGTDLPPGAGDDAVTASLAPLVQAAARRGLAVGLYSISAVSGAALSAEAAARLVAGPGGSHIVAAKVTEADYDTSTARYLAHPGLKRLKIVQGWDPHIRRALREGPASDPYGRQRAGITSGPMGLAVHQYRHLLDAAGRGDWAEVAAAEDAVLGLFAAMQDDAHAFPDLQRAKYVMGLGHPLTGTVEAEQAERLLAALERVERPEDRRRLARSLDLMGDGPFHPRLAAVAG